MTQDDCCSQRDEGAGPNHGVRAEGLPYIHDESLLVRGSMNSSEGLRRRGASISVGGGSKLYPHTLPGGGRRQPEHLPKSNGGEDRSWVQETMGDSSEAEGISADMGPTTQVQTDVRGS